MIATSFIVLILCFFILVLLGVPIAYSLGIAGLSSMLVSINFLPASTTFALRMATGLDSFSLLAIPFFVLAGNIMNKGGIAKRLIDFARVLLGNIPGKLAIVNVLSNMLFGAISGSAVASASAMGSLLTPEMKKEGYSDEFSAAINITSATTGLSIPPSNVLIIYALASGGASIAALFVAGYVPGVLTGVLIMLTALTMIKNKEKGITKALWFVFKVVIIISLFIGANWLMFAKLETKHVGFLYLIFIGLYFVYLFLKSPTKFASAISTTWRAVPSLFMLILIIGGIITGVFTATEASAVAVLYALVLSFIYKELKGSDLFSVILDSVKTTAIVLFLVSASMGLSWIIAYENIPAILSESLLIISDNSLIILLLINIMLLIVGVFLDITPAILIFTPILLPVVQAKLGIDPIHFGIILIMNLSVGLCTPPVGSVLFVGAKVADVKIEALIKPLLPIYIIMILALLIISYFPELSLWLPRYFDLL